MDTNKITVKIAFVVISFLFMSCKSSLVKSINKTYNYEYVEEGFSDYFADCIRKSRKSLINLVLEKNIVKNQRAYIIEIYGNEDKTLQAKIITERFNYDYASIDNNYCKDVKRWYPGENYDHEYFDFLVQMAKSERFEELQSFYITYPISNSGLVYLTIVDFKENKKNYKIIKTLRFQEFRIY
ncbi:hypothetical protein [Aequorivita marina]|uniref:hypothetical protein n=1 Tax=Aequorivita marina TaxID=3073654 RepID=UPI0028745BAF|nr:hypothetical protein [Aequorivita sp. S2608]MDS1298715.1 hypothetical protein [Aequorivita sp. S2608]